ncbi:hypothetical protein O1611_g7638 [Lasiodiplodia mahajangana]|uniref:Uncharacterized protein n=1 Tax=Lasiodiplodia mahajangana TaxID=1108764 RepID=A0ACC2JEV3_9PEZI|nr:hypothetical protein O1611_g7638 [Lasiodiplodia mahajangana]
MQNLPDNAADMQELSESASATPARTPTSASPRWPSGITPTGGAWADSDGVLTLTMGGSGTSGMLRFQSENGEERFTVAIGVHNWNPWVHILPDVATNETTIVLLPEYYAGGKHSGIPIVPKCSAQSSASRNFSAEFTRTEGKRYSMEIVIG